ALRAKRAAVMATSTIVSTEPVLPTTRLCGFSCMLTPSMMENAVGVELRDLVVAVAELAGHCLVVAAKQRRSTSDTGRRGGEFERAADGFDRSGLRMVDRHHHFARPGLRMREHLGNRVDRTCWHAFPVKARQAVLPRHDGEGRRHGRCQF